MKLVDFLELYKRDMGPRLRLNTWKTKESIITKRILPPTWARTARTRLPRSTS